MRPVGQLPSNGLSFGFRPLAFLLGVAVLAGTLPLTRSAGLDAGPAGDSTPPADNPVSRLQRRLDAGQVRLTRDGKTGWLRPLLRELDVPESSQILVFSRTSFQRQRIGPRTPRAVYFNDDVYVGFCPDGDVVEVSTADPRLGAVFYTLDQKATDRPRLTRQTDACLSCHASSRNQGLPGFLVRSVYPDGDGDPVLPLGEHHTDQGSPLAERWGGWYVTGSSGTQVHLGNLIVKDERRPDPAQSGGVNVTSLAGRVDTSPYLTGHSDIVALMVLEHQTEMHNRITRATLLTREALRQQEALNRELGQPAGHPWESTAVRIRGACEPLVKYLLFSGEAPLTDTVTGTSGFAEEFARRGPRDGRGRSLRQLDLEVRLFRYPCSYLIYSAAFDALPGQAKDYVLHRLWEVLSGQDRSPEFAHLSAADRKAIREILLETKPDLPAYWRVPAPAVATPS